MVGEDDRNMNAGTRERMSQRRTNPDPLALAIAQEMRRRLEPAEIILQGSRAAGDHRPDSDVDLMAVVPDEDGKRESDGIPHGLQERKREDPVVNIITMDRDNFRRTAPMAQSMAGQAAHHGVTPEGKSLGYVPDREPAPEEIRQATVYWLLLAEREADDFVRLLEYVRDPGHHLPPSGASGLWSAPSRRCSVLETTMPGSGGTRP